MDIKKKQLREYFYPRFDNWPFFVGLAFAGLGVVLAFNWDPPLVFDNEVLGKILIAICAETGFAFIIAHIIIASVDEREKDNFLEIIEQRTHSLEQDRRLAERRLASKIYLSHALDIELPKSISDELSEYLVTSRLVKRSQKIVYRLEKIGNFVKMTQSLDAVLENVDKEIVEFQPTFSRYGSEKPKIEALHTGENWGLNSADFFILKAVGATPEKVSQRYRLTHDDLVFDEPIPLAPGHLIRQRVTSTVAKYEDDNELFTNKQFSETLEVELHYDKSLLDMNIRILHPRTDCAAMTATADADFYDFKYPFLPSHGFVIYWKMK